MEKIVYLPVTQHHQQESSLLKSARNLNKVALWIAIASLAIVAYIWKTTAHAPEDIFLVIVILNGILIIYSLFEKWLDFGCMRSFVKVFAWTGLSVSVLSGAIILWFLITDWFSPPEQLLFLVWLVVIGKHFLKLTKFNILN